MTFSPETIVSLLTAIGIAGILGAYFQSRFERKKQVQKQEHELKRRRYSCILILMLTKLDPKRGLPHTHEIRPDLRDLTDVEKEIEMELLNGVLYASDNVIQSMGEFVRKPDYPSYIRTAIAMRKDLWGKRTSLDESILDTIKQLPTSV
ncbi:MAG: hypothetical protein WBL72_21540 [Thermoguttaceae bacterium]|jgi:hypothetical protein